MYTVSAALIRVITYQVCGSTLCKDGTVLFYVFFLPPTGADTRLTLGQLALCGGVF